jgi:kynurenine formamidase
MERPAERRVPRRLIELSHQIRHGMVTYPGLPGPELSDYLAREDSAARYGPGIPAGFRFHAAPPQVVGIGTFPVRAYAVIADGACL